MNRRRLLYWNVLRNLLKILRTFILDCHDLTINTTRINVVDILLFCETVAVIWMGSIPPRSNYTGSECVWALESNQRAIFIVTHRQYYIVRVGYGK